MTPEERDNFLLTAYGAAKDVCHPYPDYAACECALESAWGTSKLYVEGWNAFGEKQHASPIYATLLIPTKEFENGEWTGIVAAWVKFPNLTACFRSRLNTLIRLSDKYAGYAAALKAETGEEFVREVSKNWSTDPLRAEKVLAIYAHHKEVFPA